MAMKQTRTRAPGGGRKPAGDTPASSRIATRCTDAQEAAYRAAAAKAGLSLSAWMLSILDKASRT